MMYKPESHMVAILHGRRQHPRFGAYAKANNADIAL